MPPPSPLGHAPTQPGAPPAQRPASGTADTMKPGPRDTAPDFGGDTVAQNQSQAPTPAKPPMTPADHAVQAQTDRHMQARSQEIEAAKRLQENRTPETVKAYEAAEAATKDAAFAEQAEYRRQGGEGLPPGLRPGAREALPGTPAPSPMAESVPSPPPGSPISPAAESVSPPAAAAERTNVVRSAPDTIPDYGGDTLQAETAPAPAGPSSTLSMGLGALGSTIKFGP